MNDEANLKREEPTIERGQGVTRDVTIVSAYGHETEITRGHLLVRLNAPSFFKDQNFRRWLNSQQHGPATWPQGGDPEEYSDAFVHYGGASWEAKRGFLAEGSDYPDLPNRPGIPDHIYALIAEAVQEATGNMENEALVWISNL